MNIEEQYLSLLHEVLMYGEDHQDRTGVGTSSVFGRQIRHRMNQGFPLLTTKKMAWKNTVRELKWFISGSTNINDLHPSVHPWWKPWADENGDLGPIYGKQLRYAEGDRCIKDQLKWLLNEIKNNPNSRRLLVTTWSAAELETMRLPPCHGIAIQFKCHEDGGLSLSMYQRSADIILGVPVNIASYAFLLTMIAEITGRYPRDLILSFGDLHLYNNHHEAAVTQLRRKPRSLPRLATLLPVGNSLIGQLENFDVENFKLYGYDPHPAIKAPLAV